MTRLSWSGEASVLHESGSGGFHHESGGVSEMQNDGRVYAQYDELCRDDRQAGRARLARPAYRADQQEYTPQGSIY